MQVNDGLGERLTFIMIVIPPDRKDIGTVVGLGRFKNELISIIAKGKDEIRLPCPIPPVKIIYVGYEEEFHCFTGRRDR